MKIPKETSARRDFVQETLTRCMTSQETRRSAYRRLRAYYLWGSQEKQLSCNRIYRKIETFSGMLYAGDTTRFSVEIGQGVTNRDEQLLKVSSLNAKMDELWHESDTDTIFGDALNWALNYGATHIKPRWWQGKIHSSVVLPHDFGVYQEDLPDIADQQAFAHEYRIAHSELRTNLTLLSFSQDPQRWIDPARIDGILSSAIANAEGDNNSNPAAPRVIMSEGEPDVTGLAPLGLTAGADYRAVVAQPLVRMYELYVYDDELEDYRVFTIAHPFVPIFDRSMDQMFIPDEKPFVKVCPYPLPDYYWGIALTERLIPLQEDLRERWDQVQYMMRKQARPAMVLTGEFGDAEEVQDTLDDPGGVVIGQPGGSAKDVELKVPQDFFAEIQYIDSQFDEEAGLSNVMTGKGEAGVRSQSHASQLLRAGGVRAKRRALVVEDNIEDLATLYLKILRAKDDETYLDDNEEAFSANQLTDDFTVKVDAHSSSPIFMQDQTQIAFALKKLGLITAEETIDMLPVSMKSYKKQQLKTKIEPAAAAQKKRQEQIELATGKLSKIGSGPKR